MLCLTYDDDAQDIGITLVVQSKCIFLYLTSTQMAYVNCSIKISRNIVCSGRSVLHSFLD